MATDPTPWFVGGGAEHSPEVARLLAYASTSGAEGIVEPSSLKVTAQQVANGTVRAITGAALILNRYAGGSQQTYALRNPTATDVTIPATGSAGGRTDLIVARVLDPQYEGQPPANPLTFQYARIERIGSVPAGTKTAKELNLGYPAIALARITLPANTGTVTSEMITDLREVALPRTKSELRTYALTSGEGHTLGNTGAYPTQATWPIEAANAWADLEIPEWATRMKIILTWAGVVVPPGNAWGWVWAQLGANANPDRVITQATKYDTPNGTDKQRTVLIVADEKPIPAALRGTSQKVYPSGNVLGNSSTAARLSMDSGSSMVLQVEFMERAD